MKCGAISAAQSSNRRFRLAEPWENHHRRIPKSPGCIEWDGILALSRARMPSCYRRDRKAILCESDRRLIMLATKISDRCLRSQFLSQDLGRRAPPVLNLLKISWTTVFSCVEKDAAVLYASDAPRLPNLESYQRQPQSI